MDPQYQQDLMASGFKSNDDEAMGGVDDNMSTTPTGGYNSGYQDGPRRQSLQSENYPPANGSFSPSIESDPNTRYPSSSSGYQQQAPQPYSRPSSGLSGSGDRYGGYSQNYQDQNQRPSSHQDPSRSQGQGQGQASVVIKVGMVGDAQIGKTSLMVKYVEGSWDEDYIQTLGVNFMEKTISIRNTEITFSIWDLGGQREFVNMLPLVCNDAVAILFMFDLTRKSTLNSIKEWYRQGRGFNKTAIPFLVGTKYDHFVNFPREEQEEISTQARRFAKAMRASLIFSSTSHSINVQKIFKIVLSKAFDLKCTIPEIENTGEPLLIYQHVA
ncbi:MAG: hypothetical protein ASARMPREDX12_000204 [Alectoria sarmentosa]|nr:MAG: hypothetical protein ASARMPREDX12_000204 [Alectoria sarmentosa]CAD6568169.1 MAG: hypothetical protein ASARMPRED_001431 [Alectoria sarmentosa]